MHDEATPHFRDMIDQTTYGHKFLLEQFGFTPTVGWQIDPFGFNQRLREKRYRRLEKNMTFVNEYIACVKHCQMKMLFEGKMCGDKDAKSRIHEVEVLQEDTLKARVNRIAFLGIQDRYKLSICLFHAQYGGACHSSEFENNRPTKVKHGLDDAFFRQSAIELERRYDHVLFEKVNEIFWERVGEYHLNVAYCNKICPVEFVKEDFIPLEDWN